MKEKLKIEPIVAANYLKERDIQPSFHRLKVLEYMMLHKNHPTVEIIFKDLIKDIPTLSKTTVYNTLKNFSKKGIVSELTIEENELRFDFDTSNHAHFKCQKCNTIYDIFEKFNIYEQNILDDHKVEEKHIYFKGICKNCLSKEN